MYTTSSCCLAELWKQPISSYHYTEAPCPPVGPEHIATWTQLAKGFFLTEMLCRTDKWQKTAAAGQPRVMNEGRMMLQPST